MASLLYRIGSFAARRHWIVIVAWVLILVGVGTGATVLGNQSVKTLTIPGSPSQVANDMLSQRFPMATGVTVNVIYTVPQSKKITDYEADIEKSLAEIKKQSMVTSVSSPFDVNNKKFLSSNGYMAYATVGVKGTAADLTATDFQPIIDAVSKTLDGSGITLSYSGIPDPLPSTESPSEAIGIGISLLVLIITFGSLLAAGMPLVTAAIGVGISANLVIIATNFISLSALTGSLTSMLGLAVGIDYALFIVSRHRSNLVKGMDPKQSVAVATSTAGSAVLFAGVTVIIALLGLFVTGIPFLGMMGVGAALAVLVAILVAVTLVPALLGLFGKALVPRPNSRAHKREQSDAKPTLGSKWVKIAVAKPIVTILLVLAALVTCALPALKMQLALPNDGYNAPGSITRTGFDSMVEGWGPGAEAPLLVVADISHTPYGDLLTNLGNLEKYFTQYSDVQSVGQALPNPTLDTAIVVVTPKTGSEDQATVDLVSQMRAGAAEFEKKFGFSYQITGATATGIDISAIIANAILPYGLVVVGLSIILLMIVFRSIAVPLTATLGYVLSVAGAIGVTVAVFQWGWMSSFFGVVKPGPILNFMPILVMAVLFGLAMDYEVFLVSRMRERFVATKDPHLAVTAGFSSAVRVVTAAALIMFSVFMAFVPGGGTIASIAFALAIGVLFDAFLVRMTLIPALMTLLGKYAWALPKSWSRRLPDVDIEGERVHGRLETLAWHQGADENIVIDASEVDIVGAELAPFAVTAREGDLIVFESQRADQAEQAQLALAALTGRAQALGLLVSCGRPLPYEGAHVRKSTALAVPGAPNMEGSVEDQVAEQLRLNHIKANKQSLAQVTKTVSALADASHISVGPVSRNRSTEELSTDEAWLIDVAVALLSNARVIAVDARAVTDSQVTEFVAVLSALAAPQVTLLCAVDRWGTSKISSRKVTVVELAPASDASSTSTRGGSKGSPSRAATPTNEAVNA